MSEPNGEWLISGQTIYELEDGQYKGKTRQRNRWDATVYGHSSMPSVELLGVINTLAASKDLLAACEMEALHEKAGGDGLRHDWDAYEAFLSNHGWDGQEPTAKFIRRFRDTAIQKARKP